MTVKRTIDDVYRQLALDYCCSIEDIRDRTENVFTVFRPLEGRRRFNDKDDVFFQAVSIKGKLLFTGREDVISEMRHLYRDAYGPLFMEPVKMHELNGHLERYGYQLSQIHPFFVSLEKSEPAKAPCEIICLEEADIEEYRQDTRFRNAFSFRQAAPDVIGMAAMANGKAVAMAGASADSPSMWQIGIDVIPEYRGRHLGRILVSRLRNEILDRGAVPYYGAALSNTLSQSIAIDCGFRICWSELITSKLKNILP